MIIQQKKAKKMNKNNELKEEVKAMVLIKHKTKPNTFLSKLRLLIPHIISHNSYNEYKDLENNFVELLNYARPFMGGSLLKQILRNKTMTFDQEPIFVNCEFVGCNFKNKSEDGINVTGTHTNIYSCFFNTGTRFKTKKDEK